MENSGTRLAGKVAIVTGAGSRTPIDGVGRATSILFTRQGAKVLLVDRNLENAEKTLAVIEEEGGEASIFVGDVSENDDCQAMAEAVVERYGELHILFNSAAIGGAGTVVDVDPDVWDDVMAVNLKGMMLASKHAIPKMIEAGGGSIINIASIDGLRANIWQNIPYAVSKGGAVSLTHNMAVHHGRDKIRVNCIAPGHIYAPMTTTISDELRDLRRRSGPLGTEGTAWDIAWAGLFLASDESRWISGVLLPVDAGLLATTPLAMLSHLQ